MSDGKTITEKMPFTADVFPNPFDTKLQFTLDATVKGNVIVRLWSANGVLVQEQNVVNTGRVVLKTDKLPAGNYLLQIITNTGNRSFRVTKQ
jgi:Secretion system C-terminal sorting domain